MSRPLILFLLALSTAARAAAPDELADEAVAANPSLQAMRSSEQSLRARAEVSGAWPDPMLMVEYSNVPVTTLGLGDHPMAGLQLKVQQTLRAPGTARLARSTGSEAADARGHAVREAELELRSAVEKTWWMLVRTRMLRAVTAEHLQRTEELLAAATARYETGSLGQHAILRLQVLRDKLGDELGDFDRLDRELSASLARALSRDPGATFDTPDTVDAVAPPESVDVAGAAETHPTLDRIAAEEQAADARASLARADAIPDLTVWAGYRIRTIQTETDPGTDLVALGVGVPLPTGSGRRASGARTAALEDASAARSMHQAALDAIEADAATVLATWERAYAKASTYRDTLIPGAESTLETTRGDFSVGRADFASLFEAEVALLQLERARITAAVETHLQEAELAAVLGTSTPGATP